MLKSIKKYFLLFLVVISPSLVFSQDLDARSPKPSQGSHQQRKADIKKAKQKKKTEKGIERGKKRHLKIQARETRKMMRKSKKKAKKWNRN
ncbi:MAG: hypothetical protein EYC69_08765 [Bacteroidetes bacterium]|nr:MAG: hypothetical protein EYC69_08765 [Bacteroidota bacterium]